jgi:RNA polymerase sigma-70 factor, ECF subfamily
LFHVTPDRHTAEDVAQETFLKALKGIASFAAGTDFGAWLFRIAHNNWATHRRRGMRDRRAFPEDVAGHGAGPAECAISREALADLQGAVGRLPAGYRAAFLLRAEHGFSFREIAGSLNISAENARWRVWKARENLAESVATHLTSD